MIFLAGTTGATYFTRCGQCKTLYVAEEGFSFDQAANTLSLAVGWRRPRAVRKPIPCSHEELVEVWDGAAWVACAMPAKEQGGQS